MGASPAEVSVVQVCVAVDTLKDDVQGEEAGDSEVRLECPGTFRQRVVLIVLFIGLLAAIVVTRDLVKSRLW